MRRIFIKFVCMTTTVDSAGSNEGVCHFRFIPRFGSLVFALELRLPAQGVYMGL